MLLAVVAAALAFSPPARCPPPTLSAVAPLLDAAAAAGQVGVDASEAERAAVETAAEALQGQGAARPSEPPARYAAAPLPASRGPRSVGAR